MKTYFVKYFPVEGEIKENEVKDTWFITPKGLATFELRVHEDINTPTNKIRVHNGKTYVDFLETELKVAKLFLCSRDIQIGDITYVTTYEDFLGKTDNKTVKIENSPSHLPDGLMCYSEDGYYEYLKDCIKVIGEISPDAVWVTEGMEFDEDELEPVLFYSKHPDESIYMDTISNLEEWKKLNPNNKKNRYTPMIEIKCPTCKQFH